jgi:hypothetical protein
MLDKKICVNPVKYNFFDGGATKMAATNEHDVRIFAERLSLFNGVNLCFQPSAEKEVR